MLKRVSGIRIFGISLPLYLALFVLTSAAMRMGAVPGGMLGTLLILMMYGGLFSLIGDHLPVIRSYLGGGTIFCIFGAAVMAQTGWFTAPVKEQIDVFLNDTGFLEFFIVALIAGSILSMSRELLLRSAVRFLPVALCSMGAGMAAVVLFGWLLGYSLEDTVLYIAVPMMSGGMGAGVIPLSGMYAQASGQSSAAVISRLIPASTLGNVAAILMAALLYQLGRKVPALSGNGRLLRSGGEEETAGRKRETSIQGMGTGLLLALALYLAGVLMHRLIPAVHTYAWMIVLTALVKASGALPEEMEDASWQWSQFMLKTWTSAILIGIGAALIDLPAVMQALTPSYLFLIVVITAAVTAGAAAGGYLVGFYPVESAITAGLCTINMGGSGNIAILSASRRMELLAFAQLATRICGSLMLVVTSLLLKIFY